MALAGGNAPAPAGGNATKCPLRFDDVTVGLPSTCLFVGRYNAACGHDAVAVFAGDGQAVVVGIAVGTSSPVMYLPGQVLSDTQGKLVRWSPDLDLRTSAAVGGVTLEDGGQTLRVHLPESRIRVDGCAFSEFVGRFTEMVDAPADLVGTDPDPSTPVAPATRL